MGIAGYADYRRVYMPPHFFYPVAHKIKCLLVIFNGYQKLRANALCQTSIEYPRHMPISTITFGLIFATNGRSSAIPLILRSFSFCDDRFKVYSH